MKIQCDLCDKGEASIFCVADEAAMCDACDHRVHHANNLAGNHHHLFLLPPSPKQLPLCDICQERRAFLFCQQDRAILCTECDIPIHKANKHMQKHNRFLLNGIKISPASTLYSSSESAACSIDSIPKLCNVVPSLRYQDLANKRENASTISDYLMDVIPGWHVEDLLDPFSPFCFSKKEDVDGDVMPFWNNDFESNPSFYSPKSTVDWVPQATTAITPVDVQSFYSTGDMAACGGHISSMQNNDVSNLKPTRKWRDDNSFAVPQTKSPLSSES